MIKWVFTNETLIFIKGFSSTSKKHSCFTWFCKVKSFPFLRARNIECEGSIRVGSLASAFLRASGTPGRHRGTSSFAGNELERPVGVKEGQTSRWFWDDPAIEVMVQEA